MVRSLEHWEIDSRAKAQTFDIFRRKQFETLDMCTQEKIVEILVKAEEILHDAPESNCSVNEARLYILGEISCHEQRGDMGDNWNSVDWDAVAFQIKSACFSDSDMEGLQLAPKRVSQELIIYRSLMEDVKT